KSSFLSEPIFRLEVAARVSLRQRNVVSRDIPVLTVLASDESPHQRILKPRTARKAPVPPRREEEPPPAPQREPRHDEGVRSEDVRSQHRRRERPQDEMDGGDIDLNRSRGRIRDRDQDQDQDQDREWDRDGDSGGSRAWSDEPPRRDRKGRSHRGHFVSISDSGSSSRSPKNWTQRRNGIPPPQPPPVPVDRKMARSPRFLAVQQLVRVEEDGAYVGLVNGSPAAPARIRGRTDRAEGDADGEGDGEVDMYGGDDFTALRWRRAEGGGRREAPLDPRDQRLVKELVAGVTRLRRRLDYIVSNLSQQTPADIESGVRQVLRLGVYELTERHLAPYALNEHVQLVKAVSGPGAGSFVNGVLRSAARHMEDGTLPTPESRAAGEARSSNGGGDDGG
ncbi:hypothetical protein Vafri_1066, partial [Volvox africanus]